MINSSLHANLIAGNWQSNSRDWISVFNPATQKEIGRVPNTSTQQIECCIEAARLVGEQWKQTPVHIRAQFLFRWEHSILDSADELARIITLENGKPLSEARAEVLYTASFVRWFAEAAGRINGEIIPANDQNSDIYVTKEPVGLCALITPWNFPAAMLGRKLAAALAAGCSAICKPAEETPFSAIFLLKLAQKSGLPKGLVSLITGEPDTIGKQLCGDSRVRKLSFTGSIEVGRLLMAQSAPNLKRLSLELGGNAPLIVFEDADLEQSITGIINTKFRNAGQTCIASNRILVHSQIFDALIEKLCPRVEALMVGDGMDPNTDIGPLISLNAAQDYSERIQDALHKGAVSHLQVPHEANGHFVFPQILSNTNSNMRIWTEEVFSPLISIRVFSTDEEAINMANDTEAGLAAYFFTDSSKRIKSVSEQLEFGMIGVNTGRISMAQAPFGGVKQSGFGREGSSHGLNEYLQLKYKCVHLR